MLAVAFIRSSRMVAPKATSRLYSSSEVKVPIDLIKELRTKTKAGISDCRNALAEANLDIVKAEAILHKNAKVVADKKSSRLAAEGLLAAVTDPSNRKVAVVELLCETDFASRSPSFGATVVKLAQQALTENIVSSEDLKAAAGVKDQLEGLIYTLRENITLRRVNVINSDMLGLYMHQRVDGEMGIKADPAVNGKVFLGPRLGIVDFEVQSEKPEHVDKIAQPMVDKLAVHVLSMEPVAMTKETAPAGTDPEDILYDQEFGLFAEGKTVGQVLADIEKKVAKGGSKITLRQMHRFICGDGLEKKTGDNFAEEVEALLKK